MSKIIFLRHAETEKDPNLNASKWVLSKLGTEQSKKISENEIMRNIGAIYISEEPKTRLTGKFIAELNSINMIESSDFNEVTRGDKFLSKEQFEEEKKRQLVDLDYQAFNGESANMALHRFTNGVTKILNTKYTQDVLIITHGTVLNLYFASIMHKLDILPDRWSNTEFCAYGIIEDNKVLKDIV